MARPSRALWRLALALALLPLTAGAEGEAPPSFGEEVVVVGVRPHTAAADPTAAATVVEVSRFAGEAKSVAELVATAPGVAVNQYGGLGQLTTLSLRGSNADQVQVFLDGLPLNTGAGGGVDLSRIPRAWIERIEVVRGAEGGGLRRGRAGRRREHRHPPGGGGRLVRRGDRRLLPHLRRLRRRRGGRRALGPPRRGRRRGHQRALRLPLRSPRRPCRERAGAARSARTTLPSRRAASLRLWAAVGEGRLDAVLQLSAAPRPARLALPT